jgi:hypothetical protein
MQQTANCKQWVEQYRTPPPLFDENLEVNPMFHLKQLNEFIKLKGIPQAYQLAVARKSVVGCLSRQWLEAISEKLKNYEDFRQAFLSTWWSSSHQNLVKHSIYQAKYNRRSGLTLSGHFLKYATMASYPEPRPSDTEVIEATRYHFPLQVQRVMLGTCHCRYRVSCWGLSCTRSERHWTS